jgi:hypothetical protein
MAHAAVQKVLNGGGNPIIEAHASISTHPEITTTRPLCEITVSMASCTDAPRPRSSE